MFSLLLSTTITITAPAHRVWSILTDFPSHAEWNPFIRSISGEPAVGARLRIRVQPEGGRAMRFKPVVLACNPNQELRWLGVFLMPLLFRGEHYFLLEELDANTTRLTQGERFSGLLLPFMARNLNTSTRAGFEAMNQALKERAEAD